MSPGRPKTPIALPRTPIGRIQVRSGRRSGSRWRPRSPVERHITVQKGPSQRGRFTAFRAEVPIGWTIRGKILRPAGSVPDALPNLQKSHVREGRWVGICAVAVKADG